MKFISLAAFIFISVHACSQNKDLLKKLEQVDPGFWYQLNDSIYFKGTAWICTLPLRTVFTKVILNDSSNILSVEGYCLSLGGIEDTARAGVNEASIFLLDFDDKGELSKLFDLGETSAGFHSNTRHILPGYFFRTFTISRNDILIIGFSGIAGATAFKVGKLRTIKK